MSPTQRVSYTQLRSVFELLATPNTPHASFKTFVSMLAILSLYDRSAILKYFVRRTLQSTQGYLIGGWENPKYSYWLVYMLFKMVQIILSSLLEAVEAVSLETTHVSSFHTAKCPQIRKQLVRWLTFVLVVPSQSMIRYNFKDATPQNTYISLKTFLVQVSYVVK